MSVAGKTVIITGASSGLGAAAARKLHGMGANVVPVGRSPKKTRAIAAELGTEPLLVDFDDLRQVREFATTLRERHPRIDVLANNAGGMFVNHTTTIDGHERNLQVNALAPHLLTRLLTDQLAAGGGRVIWTSSTMHKGGRVNLRDLNLDEGFSSYRAYCNGKLAGALLAREFARRYPSIGVADFHPGVVATDFGRDSRIMNFAMTSPLRLLLNTPEKAAGTLVHLADTEHTPHGEYYVNSRVSNESKAARDPEMAAKLWEVASELLQLPE